MKKKKKRATLVAAAESWFLAEIPQQPEEGTNIKAYDLDFNKEIGPEQWTNI